MATIAIIDDDYASEILVENMRHRGFEAYRVKSASDALNKVDELVKADLVILDMIMARPNEEQASINGDIATGMAIFHAVRKKRADLPILIFTASRDRELAKVIDSTPNTSFLPKWATPSLHDIFERVEQLVGRKGRKLAQSFIVHGHDDREKLELKNFLQNSLGLPEPKILHELPNMGRTIIEKFEDIAACVDLAFVLLTPDDKMAAPDESNDDKRRARQNVIFELGYFLAALGRDSGRVLLLHKGILDLPSDLSGVIYIDISKGISSAGELIRRELRHVIE
jgi:CheY-like chemotaxis protein